VLGDRDWAEIDLWHGYQQYIADSTRLNREALPFKAWAISRTWEKFVNLARLAAVIPAYTLNDWETHNPVPGANGGKPTSTVLARRLLDALVLVTGIMAHLYRVSRRSHAATKAYLRDGKIQPGQERALGEARTLVFEWLIQAAAKDGAILSQGI
jgi:hypothetical protein